MRSIKRSEAFDEIVQRLSMSEHPASNKSMFPTIRELVCFAAVLGFENDLRKPLVGSTNEVDSRNWSHSQQATDLVYLIALASEKDGEILREENEEKMVQVFEEYAQGGFEILASWLKDMPGDLNGDEAILTALKNGGFLEGNAPDPDQAAADVEF